MSSVAISGSAKRGRKNNANLISQKDDSFRSAIINAAHREESDGNRVYVEENVSDVSAPDAKKNLPLGTKVIHVEMLAEKKLEEAIGYIDVGYNPYILGLFRENFSVVSRSDGNVYAYVEFDKSVGIDDVILVVPRAYSTPKDFYPPNDTGDFYTVFEEDTYRFIQNVAGASKRSIQDYLITERNKRSEKPKMVRQTDFDLLEFDVGDGIDTNHSRTRHVGFFDASNLEDNQIEISDEEESESSDDEEKSSGDDADSQVVGNRRRKKSQQKIYLFPIIFILVPVQKLVKL